MKPETLKARFAEDDERDVDEAIDALLLHRQGRKFLWRLLEDTGVFRNPFTANALVMSFNCGEMNVGQRLLARVTSVSPEGYMTMMKEQADEHRERERQLGDASNGADGTEPDQPGPAEE